MLDDLDGDEVAEFIGTIMDQELDTVVDDNSLDALGEALVQHFKLAVSGNQVELHDLFKKLDEQASKPKPKASAQNNEESSDESEDGGEVITQTFIVSVSCCIWFMLLDINFSFFLFDRKWKLTNPHQQQDPQMQKMQVQDHRITEQGKILLQNLMTTVG